MHRYVTLAAVALALWAGVGIATVVLLQVHCGGCHFSLREYVQYVGFTVGVTALLTAGPPLLVTLKQRLTPT